MHSSVVDGLGKISVIVALESTGNAEELARIGRMVAMHVAASNPQAIDSSGLDPALVRREKDVLADKAKAQGKPANVIDKIVESGLKTFYKEVCLLDQPFVHDDKKSVAQALKEAEGKVGGADQGHGLCALRAGRGHRAAGQRFRRRGRGNGGKELTRRRPAAVRCEDGCERARRDAMAEPIYRRVVVKVSGEALMGPDGFGIHQPTLERIAADLVATQALGVEPRRSWSAAATSSAA